MLYLAIKHLFSRKKQTLFTLLGIVLGATAYVVITGFFLGFRGFLLDELVNNDAHIHITPKEDILTEHVLDLPFYGDGVSHVFWSAPPSGRKDSARIDNPPGWYKLLDADPRVDAYSPQLTAQAILRQAKSSIPATIVGCDPRREQKIINIKDYMQEGDLDDIGFGGNRIVVGEGLMKKLGARVNQVVLVSTGSGTAAPTPFKIVGFFKTGITLFDDARAYGNLGDIQKVNNTPSQINEIGVRLKDFTQAATLASNWASISVDKVQSWDQVNANFLNVFKLQDAMRYMMIAVILVVAGFGIYNVLNMTVTQKRKEIAILRSMGFETSDVITLFFSQGFILGIVGGFIGLIFGYGICQYLTTVQFGGGPMGGAGYLRIDFDPFIYAQAVALALVSASVASVLPARAAGKMTPIEIIREGTE